MWFDETQYNSIKKKNVFEKNLTAESRSRLNIYSIAEKKFREVKMRRFCLRKSLLRWCVIPTTEHLSTSCVSAYFLKRRRAEERMST